MPWRTQLCLLALVACCLTQAPLRPLPAQLFPPSRDAGIGVWPWLVGNINGSTPAIIQQTQAAGIDTIYLHLWRTTGSMQGTLHMADESGQWGSRPGNIDPDVALQSFIAQAHAANIQVVGVVNCFLDGGPLPGDTAHEDMLLSVIDYLVNSYTSNGSPYYALDGIALDRVRFYSGTGNPASLVTSFVQRVKDRIGSLPLHAFLMASLYHIDGPPYDGSFRSYSSAMGWLRTQFGQDWEALAPILDVFCPMAYIAEGGLYGTNTLLMQNYLSTVANHARQAETAAGVTGLRVLPAVRAWNDSSGTTTSASLNACISGALVAGADGFMPFRYFTSQGQPSWWSTIGSHCMGGSDLPRPELTATSMGGTTFLLNASGATSQAWAASNLEVRFDLDNDGTADTPWQFNRTYTFNTNSYAPQVVAVEVRDPLGHHSVRKRLVQAQNPSLSIASGALSISQGGTQTLTIDAGSGAQGLLYVLLGSAAGTSPGTPLNSSLSVPLVRDSFTDLLLSMTGTSQLPNWIGTIDNSGLGIGSITVPGGSLPPSLAWFPLFFAGVGVDLVAGEYVFATNSVTLLLLP